MTDLIYDYISTGVDMMIYAAVLATVVIMLRTSSILTQYNAIQNANTERANYYREYAMYDNKSNLNCADVLSTMVYYQYDIEIKAMTDSDTYITTPRSGGGYAKVTATGLTPITYEDLKAAIGSTYTWHAYLHENGNSAYSDEYYSGGVVSGITFIRE